MVVEVYFGFPSAVLTLCKVATWNVMDDDRDHLSLQGRRSYVFIQQVPRRGRAAEYVQHVRNMRAASQGNQNKLAAMFAGK